MAVRAFWVLSPLLVVLALFLAAGAYLAAAGSPFTGLVMIVGVGVTTWAALMIWLRR